MLVLVILLLCIYTKKQSLNQCLSIFSDVICHIYDLRCNKSYVIVKKNVTKNEAFFHTICVPHMAPTMVRIPKVIISFNLMKKEYN